MRQRLPISRLAAVAVLALALGGCSALGYGDGLPVRTVVIHNHHFDPPQIEVPAETPFNLEFAVLDFDMAPMTMSSSDLGIGAFPVPGSGRFSSSGAEVSPVNLTKVKVTVPALRPGRYRFDCDCHGQPTPGPLLVVLPRAE